MAVSLTRSKHPKFNVSERSAGDTGLWRALRMTPSPRSRKEFAHLLRRRMPGSTKKCQYLEFDRFIEVSAGARLAARGSQAREEQLEDALKVPGTRRCSYRRRSRPAQHFSGFAPPFSPPVQHCFCSELSALGADRLGPSRPGRAHACRPGRCLSLTPFPSYLLPPFPSLPLPYRRLGELSSVWSGRVVEKLRSPRKHRPTRDARVTRRLIGKSEVQ